MKIIFIDNVDKKEKKKIWFGLILTWFNGLAWSKRRWRQMIDLSWSENGCDTESSDHRPLFAPPSFHGGFHPSGFQLVPFPYLLSVFFFFFFFSHKYSIVMRRMNRHVWSMVSFTLWTMGWTPSVWGKSSTKVLTSSHFRSNKKWTWHARNIEATLLSLPRLFILLHYPKVFFLSFFSKVSKINLGLDWVHITSKSILSRINFERKLCMSLVTGDPKESYYIGPVEDPSIAYLNQWPSEGMAFLCIHFMGNGYCTL